MAKYRHHPFQVTGIVAAFLLAVSQPTIAAHTNSTEQGTDRQESVNPDSQLPVKMPKTPPSMVFTNQLDAFHDSLFLRLQRPIQSVDDYFAKDKDNMQAPPISKFRLGLYFVVKDETYTSVRFEPEVEAEVRLPNLEDRWGLYVDSFRNNDLPNADLTEQPRTLNTGFRRFYDEWDMHADVGVRWRGGPAGMGRVEWRPDFVIGRTRFYPRERIFYESWNGFGEMTSLTMNYSIARCFARLVSGATWTESSNGLEWEQTFIVGHAGKLIEETKYRDIVNDEDVAQGLSLKYSIFGHNSTEQHRIDLHRISMVYRYPVHKNWIFLQIAPGIEWRNESNWENIPSIQIGLDTLFWEVTKR